MENNPNYIFSYNYSVTLCFANDIKAIVNEYYENANITPQSNYALLDIYYLQDSETVGVWDEVFTEYNCYAYALGYTSSPTGDYFPPEPGYFSFPGDFDINDPVSVWADLTVFDLKEEGYSCVYKTNNYDNAMELSDSHSIICLRKGNYPDFHYMRYRINSWYHKPANTHILRYLYYRTDIKDWTNERSFRGVDIPGTLNKSYSGTIYYFAFKTNHNTTMTDYTGNHYHSGNKHYYEVRNECVYCGDIIYTWKSVACSGPPCALQLLESQYEETQ